LIGSQQQENLGLQYLAAVAEKAGHHVTIVPLETRRDIDVAANAVLQAEPHVVGLGIAFQHSVDDYLAFAQILRDRGYEGHLTCGGQVATFCHEELLRDATALDTVVRYEGEQTLVELLERLGADQSVAGIAGLVWRQGDDVETGPPRPLCNALDSLPHPKRPARPFAIGGVPMAFLLTARGCPGDCTYCCLTAFTAAAGGLRFRMRVPAAVAEEIAMLRKQRGVRVYVVQDDLFILPSEAKSIARMRQLKDALRARDVDDVVFWIKGRPESITAPVLEAARDMGAIHLFLGVENASAERLSYLGRTHRPADNWRAIELCRAHGIRPSFNLMMFDPDCTIEDVAATVDFGADHIDLPWNLCRTEIYSGTPLLKQLAASGRLQGDYRSYGYRMRDQRAEIMFRILRVCLHERAFACDSLINRLISLSFARQIHEEFFPGSNTERLVKKVDQLLAEVYRDTVKLLRQVLDFSKKAELDNKTVHRYAVQLGTDVLSRDLRWRKQAGDLFERFHVHGIARAAGEYSRPGLFQDSASPPP